MAFFENGGQPRRRRAFLQVRRAPAWIKIAQLLVLVCFVCAGGCSDYHNEGPEAWWHAAVGGKIAEQRPPPPGDKEPFPTLASVPPKPPAANAAEWNQMTTGLITDRIKADQAAALAPIPAASARTPAAVPFAAGGSASGQSQPSQGQEPGASAALVASTPPPAVPTARQPALSTGGSVSSGSASGPARPNTAGLSPAERVANGRLPALPTREPSRSAIAPVPRRPLPPLTAAPPSAAGPIGSAVDFPLGSAALGDPALSEIKAIAALRGDHGIAITGYGGANSSDPVVQSDALNLGLSRARALATALVAQGVPYAMLRLNAEAAGRGATLRLLQ